LDENLKKETKVIKDSANLDFADDSSRPEVYDQEG